MSDKNILEEFYEVLTADERLLLVDYIRNPNFPILSNSFDKIARQSAGSQTQDN
jgi:hypothetical protein